MTNFELAELAMQAARETTDTYQEWRAKSQRGEYRDVTKTAWWRLFDALGRIGVEESQKIPLL